MYKELVIRSLKVLSFLFVAAGAIFVAIHWPILPEKVPVHFGLFGEVDSWGPKWTVWLLPGSSLFLYALLNFAGGRAKTDKRYPNIKAVQSLIAWHQFTMSAMLFYMEWVTVNVALTHSGGLGVAFLPTVLAALFIPQLIFHLSGNRFQTARRS